MLAILKNNKNNLKKKNALKKKLYFFNIIKKQDNYFWWVLINNTKKIIYPKFEKWDKNSIDKCIICLDCITDDEYVYNLKCGTEHQLHIFHKLCLEKWNKSSCPYCRTEITNELK